jgi:hypothetical protein
VARTDIRIDCLNIRSRGVSPALARAAVQDLGPEILQGLSQHGQNLKSGHPIHLDTLKLDTVRMPPTQTAPLLRTAIAQAVVRAISTHANPTGGQ